jgi:hypothetical protein
MNADERRYGRGILALLLIVLAGVVFFVANNFSEVDVSVN